MKNKKGNTNFIIYIFWLIFFTILIISILFISIYSLEQSKTLCGNFFGYQKIDSEHYNCCTYESHYVDNSGEGYWEREAVCIGHTKT